MYHFLSSVKCKMMMMMMLWWMSEFIFLKTIIWTILLCFYDISCNFRELCSINHHPLSFNGQQKLLDSNLTSIFRFHGKKKEKKGSHMCLEQHKGWGQYFNFWVNYSFKDILKAITFLLSKDIGVIVQQVSNNSQGLNFALILHIIYKWGWCF